jgi:uncharacterized protein
MQWTLALAGLLVGFIVGLTGMGGGALTTPMLVLFFHVQPLAAVSSDLVASFFMKPVGGFVHLRRGTVDLPLVKWLCVGSVPGAFAGVFVLRALGVGRNVQNVVTTALGIALVVAAAALVAKTYMTMRQRARRRAAGLPNPDGASSPRVAVRPVPTILVGLIGGLIVGMTSVGSGSLIIVALLILYPKLRSNELVGTDLVQAIPLVASAALAHILFGNFQLALTASLLVGAIPGVFIGAQASSRAPAGIVRRCLTVVLLASGLKLLGVPNAYLLTAVIAAAVAAPLVWMAIRRSQGLPATARAERGRELVSDPSRSPSDEHSADAIANEPASHPSGQPQAG